MDGRWRTSDATQTKLKDTQHGIGKDLNDKMYTSRTNYLTFAMGFSSLLSNHNSQQVCVSCMYTAEDKEHLDIPFLIPLQVRTLHLEYIFNLLIERAQRALTV